MHVLYVDVPNDYPYNWNSTNQAADAVLTRDFSEKFEFMVNHLAELSQGDIYRVELDDEKDELFFLLKTGFTKLPFDTIDTYVTKRDIRNRNRAAYARVRS